MEISKSQYTYSSVQVKLSDGRPINIVTYNPLISRTELRNNCTISVSGTIPTPRVGIAINALHFDKKILLSIKDIFAKINHGEQLALTQILMLTPQNVDELLVHWDELMDAGNEILDEYDRLENEKLNNDN